MVEFNIVVNHHSKYFGKQFKSFLQQIHNLASVVVTGWSDPLCLFLSSQGLLIVVVTAMNRGVKAIITCIGIFNFSVHGMLLKGNNASVIW